MKTDNDVVRTLEEAERISRAGRPVLIEADIDYGRKTFFTAGVVSANLHRLPIKDRIRFIGRAVLRKVTG